MQIIAGSSHHALAQNLAKQTGYELLQTRINNFSNGEIRVEVQGIIKKEVVIIQSTSYPVNDRLMELMLLVDTAKRAGAKEIIALLPYFGYSRQDRCTYKNGPISAALVIKILEAAGVTKFITLDLHSAQLEGIFNIPIINLDPASIFAPFFRRNPDVIIVSPDIGGINRAHNFSSLLGCDMVVTDKTRGFNNECVMNQIIGKVERKNCIIIDDIVDSADTLCKAADLLMENGACAIEAYVTHAVLSGDSVRKIEKSPIDRIFISNSICHESLPSKFVVTTIDELLANII